MRSTQLITGALAVAATSALVGLGAAPTDARTTDTPSTARTQQAAAQTPGVTRERGIVLECTGTLGARPVIATLYENRTYGNFLELLVGDGDNEVAASRESAKPFLAGSKLRAQARLGGKKATITGTVKRTNKVTRIHEVVEDAGERIVSTGTHRKLKPRLTFTYGKRSTSLTCDPAFAYRLKVTKTSIVD